MTSIGGEHMKVPKRIWFGLLISASIPYITKSLVSLDTLASAFILLLGISLIVNLYYIYTLYEMKFLHEKQVSKLTLSQNKLYTSH